MPKRVHQLAKELNVTSKVLIDKLNNLLGIEAKNHMTLLEEEQVEKVLVLFGISVENDKPEVSTVDQKVEDKVQKAEKVEVIEDVVPQKDQHDKTQETKTKSIKIDGVNDKIEHKIREYSPKNEVVIDVEPEHKLDKDAQIIIEKYLNDDRKTNKIEKIGPRDKAGLNEKRNYKNNFKKRKDKNIQQVKQEPALPKKITIHETVMVKDLAEKLRKSAGEVIKRLFLLGIVATINQEIDYDTAEIIAMEYGVEVEIEAEVHEEERLINDFEDKEEDLEARPPIVVVMGHVDHGKTSLLDAIRETNVIAREAGGITQHIGAYSVNINGKKITFLDTPGHAAFTAMRARGAQVTDIAILVVAADDSIMPQTIEAINHAKAAGISTIIAINKIDKPTANIEKVKQDLSQHGLIVEDWGGDVITVPISAKERINIDQLLEMVLLTADMLELKANPKRHAKGTVIESKLDKGRGPVATILVQNGTLNIGDNVVVGNEYGKVRAMIDDKGNNIKKAKPSIPVEILGLSGVPNAGDEFYAVEDEKTAKQVAEKRRVKSREANMKNVTKVSLEQLFEQIQQNDLKELNIIVKADVQGSAQAVKQSLEKLTDENVRINVIHSGVGAITESDVMLASASNALIIGFNIRTEPSAVSVAKRENVDIKLYSVIYKAIEDIQAAMKGMLDPEFKEEIMGHAEVRNIFRHSSIGTIAGCRVIDGKLARNAKARLLRDNVVMFEGDISSLKREKDDAREVQSGYECGLTLHNFNDIVEGDIIECFEIKQVER